MFIEFAGMEENMDRPMSKEVRDWMEMERRIHEGEIEMLDKLIEEKHRAEAEAKEGMKPSDLYDVDGFLKRYADADLSELRQARSRLLAKHWEYQNTDKLLSDEQFAEVLEIKIELALLGKLIWLKRD